MSMYQCDNDFELYKCDSNLELGLSVQLPHPPNQKKPKKQEAHGQQSSPEALVSFVAHGPLVTKKKQKKKTRGPWATKLTRGSCELCCPWASFFFFGLGDGGVVRV